MTKKSFSRFYARLALSILSLFYQLVLKVQGPWHRKITGLEGSVRIDWKSLESNIYFVFVYRQHFLFTTTPNDNFWFFFSFPALKNSKTFLRLNHLQSRTIQPNKYKNVVSNRPFSNSNLIANIEDTVLALKFINEYVLAPELFKKINIIHLINLHMRREHHCRWLDYLLPALSNRPLLSQFKLWKSIMAALGNLFVSL